MRESLSAVIITLNEESNLARCLDGLDWVDEIIIADTGSTDDTKDVARKYTQNVYSIPWNGFGDAYNRALDFATKDWILFVHADEELTKELIKEIKDILSDKVGKRDGYYIARLPNFLGHWVKHGGWFPSYEMRLFRRGKGRCNTRIVHQDVEIEGEKGYLKSYLLHYTDPSLEIYLEKMNRFTTMAAKELFDNGRRCRFWDLLFRPPAVFHKMFITKAGFMDGFVGFLAAGFSSLHVFVKYLKLKKLWDDYSRTS